MEQIQRKHDLTSLTVKQLIERRLRLERLALTCEDTENTAVSSACSSKPAKNSSGGSHEPQTREEKEKTHESLSHPRRIY
jgi:hypothetical protein